MIKLRLAIARDHLAWATDLDALDYWLGALMGQGSMADLVRLVGLLEGPQ